MTNVKWMPLLLGSGLVLLAIVLLVGSLFSDEIFPEYSPSHEGRFVAEEAGCFDCHVGIEGEGARNPESDGGFVDVPDLFHERHSIEVLRQWVRDGISESKKNSQAHMAALEKRALQMPAYGDSLSSGEIEQIIDFIVLLQYQSFAEASGSPSRGENLAREYACFTCHGELGQGGVSNPGSLKGYIPGFFGNDFRALTRNGNRQDIREWIEDGHSEFFWNQGFAGFYPGRYFTRRQAIQMPAYGDHMNPEEVEILTDYLIELMNRGPLDAEDLMELRPISAHDFEEVSASPDAARDASAGEESLAEEGGDSFRAARAVLEGNCLECHGPEKQRSGFRLDYREAALKGGEIAEFKGTAAIVPGAPSESLVIQFVEAEEEDPFAEIYPMPPDDKPSLSQEEIARLRVWIEEGAPWPEAVTLEPKD